MWMMNEMYHGRLCWGPLFLFIANFEHLIHFCITSINVHAPDGGLEAVIQSVFAHMFRCNELKGKEDDRDGDGAAKYSMLQSLSIWKYSAMFGLPRTRMIG